ncbi:Arv1-domain-containing protein [Auricularia subglabra TFB-10046 SS5]|nr:Arv1-domain-containing protein [Auricularia subglabra TFB-10046 SS5]
MPLCITCATYMQYLYTVYDSAENLRLEVCPSCRTFADPYVEHEGLIVLLDLMLLKIGAYRHLLFNRGSTPRREGATESSKEDTQNSKVLVKLLSAERWKKILSLALPMVVVDSCTARSPGCLLPVSSSAQMCAGHICDCLPQTICATLTSTVAFHLGVTLACAIVLMLTDFWGGLTSKGKPPPNESGIHREFRFSHVPLTLIYSSVTKLFLLFLLSVWRSSPPTSATARSVPQIQFLPDTVLSVFDESVLDRAWVVRNILGGMAAGFGLRIILDCHPLLTMIVVLIGWSVKTAVAAILGSWVAGPARTRIAETWLAYSIP